MSEVEMSRENVLDPSWAHRQAKMLVLSSFQRQDTEQTFHVLNIKFLPSPFEKAIKISVSFSLASSCILLASL